MKALFILILSLLLGVPVFAQNCDKHLKKQKQQTSSVFESTNNVMTKWRKVYEDGRRSLYFRLTSTDGDTMLVIQQQTENSFKQPLKLGPMIKIALVFNSGEHEIISFENNEENVGEVLGETISRNFLALTPSLAKKLETETLVRVEIKRPFGVSNMNSDKVLIENLKSKRAEKLRETVKCFLIEIE